MNRPPWRGWAYPAAAAGLAALQAVLLYGIASATLPLAAGWHRGDLRLYYQAGLRLLGGQLPYRDFPLEYPPAALIPFVLPHLAAGGRLSLTAYTSAFLLQMVLLSSAGALALAWGAARGRLPRPPLPTLALYALGVAVAAPLLPWRYDLFPALLTLLALLGVLTGRPTLGGLALGLAVAAKLYPLVLLPVFGLAYLVERRYGALTRLLLGCGATIALAVLPVLPPDPGAWLASLGYVQVRGLQIETLPGGVLLLVNAARLARVGVTFTVGAFQLASPLADAVVRLQPLLMAAGLGTALAACAHRFRRDRAAVGAVRPASLIAGAVLMLLVFLSTNKVFSAQHTIWLLPFAALLPLRQAALVVGLLGLTNVLFPWLYEDLTDGHLLPVLVLNARNALVLALLLWLLLESLDLPRRAGRSARGSAAPPGSAGR